MSRVLLVAGDLSGDEHAARVAAEIKSQDPAVEILAIGGPALRAVADRFLFDLVEMSVVGFWEPVKKLPAFLSVFRNVLKPILTRERPDIVVPVDFFGFNRFTAQEAHRLGLKVYYFISPQVWASRPGRIQILKKCVNKLLVIFPFEEKLYSDNEVSAAFVGHPLLDALPEALMEEPARMEPVVGLLPGSRPGEVHRHLPVFLETARLLSDQKPGIRFVLFAARSLSNDFYDRILAKNGAKKNARFLLEVVRDETYQWRARLDFALTSSGTATLENALLGIPMAVVYKVSWITYWLARALIRVPYISMVNILSGKALVPELIQHRAIPKELADVTLSFLQSKERCRTLRRELLKLRNVLGGPGASRRAAQEILAAL